LNDTLLLAANGLEYDTATRTLWDDISLSVGPGQALAIRGVSGQGKSTLLRCLGGLTRPTRGSVQVLGADVHGIGRGERRLLRRDVIGFVMQDHAVVPEWSVAQNLRVVRPRGVSRAELDARVAEALEAVGLDGRQRSRAGLLSGGEQQRVAVARVLVQRPRVVLADEPTASLDDLSAARVRGGLDAVRARGGAVVMATHNPELIAWCGEGVELAGDA
jgi:ABC-type lipoprotein export system ATPase subunit